MSSLRLRPSALLRSQHLMRLNDQLQLPVYRLARRPLDQISAVYMAWNTPCDQLIAALHLAQRQFGLNPRAEEHER